MAKTIVSGLNLASSTIREERYENVAFQLGNCDETEFIGCVFSEIEFEGLWTNDALFEACRFEAVLFYDVQGFRSKFHRCKLTGVQFAGCNLSKADFSNCTFEGVTFGRDNIGSVTDITGASFDRVSLEGVSFENVEYDADTIFPYGFDPRKIEGLKLV